MSIYERVRLELGKEYENSNQNKIAQKGKVSQVTISRYLTNIDNIKAMRLDTFFSLFPNADIVLNKSKDKSLSAKLNSFINNLTDADKEKALQVLSTIFPEYIK